MKKFAVLAGIFIQAMIMGYLVAYLSQLLLSIDGIGPGGAAGIGYVLGRQLFSVYEPKNVLGMFLRVFLMVIAALMGWVIYLLTYPSWPF